MKFARPLFLFLLLALAVPAVAAADTEPNNGLWQAQGPIAGGVDIQGGLATEDDSDWFVFYAKPQQEIHLTSRDLDDSGYSLSEYCLDLRDSDGAALPYDYTTPPGAPRRYFIDVHSDLFCHPSQYAVRVDPASAVTTGDPLPSLTPTAEPNENDRQAQGPITGATTYTGTLDTANDEDWFYLYTAAGTHQLDIAVTGASDCSPTVELIDPSTDLGDGTSVSPNSNTVEHITRTITGEHRLAIRINAGDWGPCVGSAWQFRVEPSGALTQTPPSGASGANCDAEYARYLSAKRAVTGARRALRKAHGKRARQRAKRRLRAAEAKADRAQRAWLAC